MKAPSIESRHDDFLMDRPWAEIVSSMSRGKPFDEVVFEKYGIPPVKYLVEESIPFRNNLGEGWFIIKAVCQSVFDDSMEQWKIQALGYLELKKLRGLFRKTLGCLSDLETGFYTWYPKELVDLILQGMEKRDITAKTMDQIIQEEKKMLGSS